SVSFVLAHSDASAVYVAIEGAGFWTTHDVPRLPGKRTPVFAVSLERDQIPQGVVYRYEVESRGRTLSIVDPHAWTITSRNGQPVAVITEADPQHGRIELVRDVKPSSGSLTPRDLYVYLPPGYQTDTEARCPVLYMHDGQNCWDDPTEPFGHGGWQVNLIADRLIAAGKIEPVIVVGIPNTPDRVREYGPGADILSAADHAYIRYLIRDVKPAIDHRYPPRCSAGQPACHQRFGSRTTTAATTSICPRTPARSRSGFTWTAALPVQPRTALPIPVRWATSWPRPVGRAAQI
ncbi:MAG: alpha/beta hydrolase, partial [Planctomycetota bacterium]